MTIKKFTRLFAVMLALAMMLLAASCDLFKGPGSLKLESFTVVKTSVKTEYEIGEEIDFSDIKAIAKYNDETLNKEYGFADLTITYDKDITATAGTKKVTVSFMDPNLNVKQETTVTITVVEGHDDNNDPAELPTVSDFLRPSALTQFDEKNKNAGTLSNGQSGFFGQFAVGNQVYVIGNQNPFTMNLTLGLYDPEADDFIDKKEFFTTVDLFVKNGGEYVALTKTEKEGNVVEYYDGDVLIATVNTYRGTYQFTAEAADKLVKISVFPSEEKYVVEDVNPVVLEAKIINAYNIYEAWQLAVADNSNAEWTDFKTAHGIAGVTVSGIVLHNDIALTADDVPASFFYTSEKDVVYTDTSKSKDDPNAQPETKIIPKGSKFLKDGTFIYKRDGVGDFVIEGNFFTLNTKGFPLIASYAVFGKDSDKGYGSDFSNASLFKFDSVDWGTVVSGTVPTEVADVTVNNISLIGNAAREFFVDAEGGLASAGGLIFLKSSHYTNTKMNNLIGNSYFITYFVDYGASMYVSNSKCYDSYQNAAFVWGNSKLEMVDTYVNGCGGPVIIAQSELDKDAHPIVTVTGGKLETHLGGQEIWFTAVNATEIVSKIKGMGTLLNLAGYGNFVDKDNNMNIIGAVMANGTDAEDIVMGINAQGSIFVDGSGMDRFQTAENVNWALIKGISEYAEGQSGTMPPFFTVYDANGTAYSFYYNGQTFLVPMGATPDTHVPLSQVQPIIDLLKEAKAITLTQGGLSVVFEFYHGADAYQIPAN